MSQEEALALGYQCPLCGQKMARDLTLFLDHTQQHIIDQIQKGHPEWKTGEGICQPCVEYYQKAFQGELPNIGPKERRKRVVQGVLFLIFSLGMEIYFHSLKVDWQVHAFLFIPLFISIFCLIQAQEKVCAILAHLGTQNLDEGEEKITNSEIAESFRRRGKKIVLKSFFLALVLTALIFIFYF